MSLWNRKAKEAPLNLWDLKFDRACTSETTETGCETILIPRFSEKNWLGRMLSARAKDRRYHKLTLDDVGTHVWKRLDGHTPVSRIADSLKAEFGDRVEPLPQRLGLFFQQLRRARVIRLRADSGASNE